MKKSEEPNYMPPLPKNKFVAVGYYVHKGSEVVLRAISRTIARRTANALNRYEPGKKGY